MVSTNEQTDFGFPFGKKETPSIFPNNPIPLKFDSIDYYLSAIAISFFLAILLMISLDGKKQFNSISQNSIVAPNFQPAALITPIKKSEIKIASTPIVVENKISSNNSPDKKVATSKSKRNKIDSNPGFPKKEIITPKVLVVKKSFVKKEILLPPVEQTYLNQSTKNVSFVKSVNPLIVENTIEEVVTKPMKQKISSPKKSTSKPISSKNKLEINETIPVQSLPVSYFAAKTKAEIEGKLLIIKFGAKWCLPCREMNNTTFKNKEVKNLLEKDYVSLNIDVQDFDGVNMQSYFNVKMLPTMLFFNSSGKFIAQYAEFVSTNNMLQILEKHTNEENINLNANLPEIKNIIIQEELTPSIEVEKFPSIIFNHINLQKTKTGKPITSLNSKAKNWRFTNVDFSTKYISEGELLLKVKETKSGKTLSQVLVPWANSNLGITDSTTNFQLEIPHKKRKKKKGNYVLEIFHVTPNSSILIGKKQLIEDGKVLN